MFVASVGRLRLGSVSDAATTAVIQRVHAENFGVYGVRKVHASATGRATRWPDAPSRLMKKVGCGGSAG